MKEISRQEAVSITSEIEAAIDAILEKHGLSKDKARTTYGCEYTFKVTASIHNTDEFGINVDSIEMDALRLNAKLHGIADIGSDIGTVIEVGGKRLLPAGYKPRATKRPFVMKDLGDGKLYNYPASIAKFFPSYDESTNFVLNGGF